MTDIELKGQVYAYRHKVAELEAELAACQANVKEWASPRQELEKT